MQSYIVTGGDVCRATWLCRQGGRHEPFHLLSITSFHIMSYTIYICRTVACRHWDAHQDIFAARKDSWLSVRAQKGPYNAGASRTGACLYLMKILNGTLGLPSPWNGVAPIPPLPGAGP